MHDRFVVYDSGSVKLSLLNNWIARLVCSIENEITNMNNSKMIDVRGKYVFIQTAF